MSSVGGADDVPWDDAGLVVGSRCRISVLNRLSEGPVTPTQTVANSESTAAHTSRVLQELRDRSLMEPLVPGQRRKRWVYGITDDTENTWHVTQTQQMA